MSLLKYRLKHGKCDRPPIYWEFEPYKNFKSGELDNSSTGKCKYLLTRNYNNRRAALAKTFCTNGMYRKIKQQELDVLFIQDKQKMNDW